MERNREGYLVSDDLRECTNCGSFYKRTSKNVTLCFSCNSARVKGESPEVRMYRRCKARAKERGIEFALEKSDIIIPEFCPVLNVKLEVYSGKPGGRPNSPALDRIDNSKGYVKGNVWVISHKANMMKSAASSSELRRFAEWILSNVPAEEVASLCEHNESD